MSMQKSRKWLLPLLCYLAALVVYLGASLTSLTLDSLRIRNGSLRQTNLAFEDFEAISFQPREKDGTGTLFVSTNNDPQLLYTPEEPFFATRFTFDAKAINIPSGEMVLYYTIRPDAPFSERQKLWARQNTDGSWYFNLGGRKIYSLRFDPDSVEQAVLWDVRRISLNDPVPLYQYFLPTAGQFFLLLALPAFAAALLREAAANLHLFHLWWRAKRRKDKK